jgi:iron complex transport system ATP-binding protein
LSALLATRDLQCRRGGLLALDGVTLEMAAGEFVALCGLNGAGKSTLLELLAGLLTPSAGECRFLDRPLRTWPRRRLTRQLSYLPQFLESVPPLLSDDVIAMGRYPHSDGWTLSHADRAACDAAIARAGCQPFLGRRLSQLSGGERQRVLFAAALAPQPRVLLADEPGAFVDLPHQVQLFRQLKELAAEGLLCVAATHDLNLAARFSSRMVLLHQGRLVADGAPDSVLHGTPFRSVFGPDVTVEPIGGRLQVIYGGA